MPSAHGIQVHVLCGGHWPTRELSLLSAEQVADALLAEGLSVQFLRSDPGGWSLITDPTRGARVDGEARPALSLLASTLTDGVAFNALYGMEAIDGRLPAICDLAAVPCTGASLAGGVLANHRQSFRDWMQSKEFDVPPGAHLFREQWALFWREQLPGLVSEVGFPALVKAANSCSPYASTIVLDAEALQDVLRDYFQRERAVVVERLVQGRELRLLVLGTRVGVMPILLPTAEIEQVESAAESTNGSRKQRKHVLRASIPAKVEDEVLRHIGQAALRLHMELDLGGASEITVVLGPDGPLMIECNTVPALLAGSLLPQTAQAAGIDFRSLCRRWIDYALSAHLGKQAQP